MKKTFLMMLFCLLYQFTYAQIGASVHQSNLPFVGINYEIVERFLPELRLGTDNYFENTSLEVALNYIFKRNEMVNVYAGIGVRTNLFQGPMIPVGMNIYPFEKDNFGFHMELAGLLSEDPLLRGSWGIRYRFLKD